MRKTLFAILAASASMAAGAQTLKYQVVSITTVELGTLGGNDSWGAGINNGGDVVGSAMDSSGKRHAFMHTSGSMFSLHDGTPAFQSGAAADINDGRIVVGSYKDSGGKTRPFRYQLGLWVYPMSLVLDTAYPYDWQMAAEAVSNNGRVAGWAFLFNGGGLSPPLPDTPDLCFENLPLRWATTTSDPVRLYCIADPDGNNTYLDQGVTPKAMDVNEQGAFVGADGGTSQYSSFLWKNGVRYTVPKPAGLSGFDANGNSLHGVANGINNADAIAGSYGSVSLGGISIPNKRAYYWNSISASAVNLGKLPGDAYSEGNALNDQHMVVGSSHLSNTTQGVKAFIWHADFGMKKLTALPAATTGTPVDIHCVANAVNNWKITGLVQVAGTCKRVDGKFRAVRWDVMIDRVPVP